MKDRIKTIRKMARMNQTQFSKVIGVSQQTVTAYENGYRTPHPSVLQLICKEFDINSDWLISGVGEMKAKVSPQKEIADLTLFLAASSPDSPKYQAIMKISKILEDLTDEEFDDLARTFQLFSGVFDIKKEPDGDRLKDQEG